MFYVRSLFLSRKVKYFKGTDPHSLRSGDSSHYASKNIFLRYESHSLALRDNSQ